MILAYLGIFWDDNLIITLFFGSPIFLDQPPMFIVSNHRTILLGLLKSGGHHIIPGGFWAPHNKLGFGRMIVHWNLRHFHKYISYTCEHFIYIYTRCVYNNNSNNNNII